MLRKLRNSEDQCKGYYQSAGRVLYETSVASGPFRIQDINEAVSGELNVRVEEQDGGVQEFVVNTANIPYLTRPGSVRFKLTMGKPSDWQHHLRDPMFGTGELSWGSVTVGLCMVEF